MKSPGAKIQNIIFIKPNDYRQLTKFRKLINGQKTSTKHTAARK